MNGSVTSVNPGYSLITREIEQQKEREAELRQHWKEAGIHSERVEPVEPETPFSLPELVKYEPATPIQQGVLIVAPEATQETASEHPPDPLVAANGKYEVKEERLEARAPAVKPLLDAIELATADDRGPRYEPINETAVERDIRLSKERQAEMRVMRGQPVDSPDIKSVIYVSYEETSDPEQRSKYKYRKGSEGDNKGNQKRFFASKMQREIAREQQLEEELKNSGRIKTVSEESKTEVKKYIDVMVDDSVPAPPYIVKKRTQTARQHSYPLTAAVSLDSHKWKPKPRAKVQVEKKQEDVAEQIKASQPDEPAPNNNDAPSDVLADSATVAVVETVTIVQSENEPPANSPAVFTTTQEVVFENGQKEQQDQTVVSENSAAVVTNVTENSTTVVTETVTETKTIETVEIQTASYSESPVVTETRTETIQVQATTQNEVPVALETKTETVEIQLTNQDNTVNKTETTEIQATRSANIPEAKPAEEDDDVFDGPAPSNATPQAPLAVQNGGPGRMVMPTVRHSKQSGESIVERELREARERESDLRQQRSMVTPRLVTQYDKKLPNAPRTSKKKKVPTATLR